VESQLALRHDFRIGFVDHRYLYRLTKRVLSCLGRHTEEL
jgi:hypothetical protein